MKLKEKIVKEIEEVPDYYLIQIEKYLSKIKKNRKNKIKTLSLKGKYDKINIRKLAYEE